MTEFDIVTGNFTKYESTNDSLSPRYSYGIQNMRTRLVLKIGVMCVILFFAAMLFYPFDNRPHLEFKDGEWTYFSTYYAPSFFAVEKPLHDWSETSRPKLLSFLRGEDGTDCSTGDLESSVKWGVLTRYISSVPVVAEWNESIDAYKVFFCKNGEIVRRSIVMDTNRPESDGYAAHFDAFLSESIQLYDGQFQSEKQISTYRHVDSEIDAFIFDGTIEVSRIVTELEWKDSSREVSMNLSFYDAAGGPRITIIITDTASEAVGLDL